MNSFQNIKYNLEVVESLYLLSNPKTLDEAFSLDLAAEARFTDLQLLEFSRSYPLTLGEAFFRTRITEAHCEDKNNQAVDANVGDQEEPDVKDKQEVKKADDLEIKIIQDEEGKNAEDQQVFEADDETNIDDFDRRGRARFARCNQVVGDVGGVGYSKADGTWVPARRIEDGKKGTDGTWVLKIHNLEHNHEPSTDMSRHPSFRRLPEEDVHTEKPRKDDLGNRSLVGALLEELEKGGFSHDVDHDLEGCITRLFIIHPLSLKLARIFSNVFVMDCTYKTNKYKMPFLDIIGVSCFNTSFYSGFVFLKKEDKDSYVWALKVFKKFLGHASQPAVIISDRELALMNGINDVSTSDFHEVKKNSLAVVNEFNEIKVKLASERIKIPHDCNMPLFRELLSHVSLFALKEIYKQYIKKKDVTTCTGHFMATMGLPCVHKINSLQGMTLSLDLVHPHRRIDTLSLDPEDDAHNEIDEQFAKLLNELQSKYQAWPLSKKELATSMLTKFLNQPDILSEPVIQRPRGRPPKAKKKRGVTSTTRDPSRFEYVESSQAQDPSSSSNGFPKTIHQENGVIDLNAFPDF
ncbi:protein FAR1-related sequence 5 [Tanacetum coccineum]